MLKAILERVKGEPVATAWLLHSALVVAMELGLPLSRGALVALDIFIAALLSWAVRQNVSPVAGKPLV